MAAPVEIRSGFDKTLGGASRQHDPQKCFGEEIIALLDTVWPRIRENNVVQNGINIVVYDPDGTIFAGVELSESEAQRIGLASKRVTLPQYGYCKHSGPYSQIFQTCKVLDEELKQEGFKPRLPMVEIYGHWTQDESKLETEILKAV